MKILTPALIWTLLPLQGQEGAETARAVIQVPARTAFGEPDARAMRRHKDGSVTRWKGTLHWFGRIASAGELTVSLRLEPGAEACKLRLAVRAQPDGKPQVRSRSLTAAARELYFGSFEVKKAGFHRLSLSMESKGKAPGLMSIALSGSAANGAHFALVERRNAASVHLGYPLPDAAKDKVEWFYCEVTPKTDPLLTYYEATGWHRGYFGMQVNSPKERRIIFSVWDAGKEPVSRSKVAKANRVELLAKGKGVHASGFGNEGTGGHSHLVYPWKLGDTLRFLVRGQVDGNDTIYSGWYSSTKDKAWKLIVSFRAPRDGKTPRGLYSFNENFGGANGHLRRLCEFHNQWVRTTEGKWIPLLQARFTHDGHGRKQRLDRSAGVRGDRFYLANGGFVDDPAPTATTKAHTLLQRTRGKQTHPTDADLPR